MTSDLQNLILSNPEYGQYIRERRAITGRLALLVVLLFTDYLALLIAVPDWIARPLWGGRMTIALPVTLWLIVFMMVLVRRYATETERRFDWRLQAILNEAKRAL
jgi:uncharacterized membrane protein (DUF485 family)